MTKEIVRKKLTSGELHILRLAKRDAGPDGWVKVSRTTWPWVCKVPSELVELRSNEDEPGGYVRLTERGHGVAIYGGATG